MKNEVIKRLIGIRTKQLKVFENLTLFEQNILCHQLPHFLPSTDVQHTESERQHLQHKLARYETDIQLYEQMYENAFRTLELEISRLNASYPDKRFHAVIYAIKNYIYQHSKCIISYIRHAESCRLVTLKHRYRRQCRNPKLCSTKVAFNVYPQIISDVAKSPLNHYQLDFLSQIG